MSSGESDPFRAPRRWRVPHASVHGNGQLEGLSILKEIPGELGGLLWQTLRSVTLWSRVSPARRAGLFNADVGELRREEVEQVGAADLQEPLSRIVDLLEDPEGVNGEKIGRACQSIAGWAARSGASTTELEFLVGAALASPGDPLLALVTARAYRDRGEYVLAEAWYQRTIALARLEGAWDAYARAYIGLGKTRKVQGREPEARRSFAKAQRAARRNGIREVQGMALHDLFSTDAVLGDHSRALEEAAAAMRAYGPGHRLLPSLAHDVARFWLDTERPELALRVMRAVIPKLSPLRRTLAVANLGLAAALVGERETFREALLEVDALPGDAPLKTEAMVSLARGAFELGLHDHANEIIRAGRDLARVRGETGVVAELDALLSIPYESAPANAVPAGAEADADRLADDLVAYLAASAPAGVPA